MKEKDSIQVLVASEQKHLRYVGEINDTIQRASEERGTGIARRTDEYIGQKIKEGKAIVALEGERFAGFCYIETWGHNRFVANSGLIVSPQYRGMGLAKRIKEQAFALSRKKFPNARIFGLTTGLAVMKINSDLGYRPVTFSELTDDQDFWKGCRSCVNYDILMRTQRTKCLCTAMLFDPNRDQQTQKKELKKEGRIVSFKKWLSSGSKTEETFPLRMKLFNKH